MPNAAFRVRHDAFARAAMPAHIPREGRLSRPQAEIKARLSAVVYMPFFPFAMPEGSPSNIPPAPLTHFPNSYMLFR
jgi:hypothetical protein